ncbi:MAG: HAD family phosphatase [Bacilli bacterium]|nr:HAD family phosphatase [Bacilli bacterium]
MTKLIIFDMDGVIFDSEKLYLRFLRLAMARCHYNLTKQQYISTLGLTEAATKIKMQELFGLDFNYDKIYSDAKQEMMKYIEKKGIPIKEGIINLLDYLIRNHFLVAIASSTDKNTIQYYLQKANLMNYFPIIVGGDDVVYSKPNPEIFLKACSKANVNSDEAIVIEDSPNGLLAAINATIPAICIPDLKFPPKEIVNQCLAILKNANEVIDIIKRTSK